jgi:hypothetical protein
LGFSAGLALIIIWALWFSAFVPFQPHLALSVRGLLMVALGGSGGRFANVGTVVCLGLTILILPQTRGDLAIMVGAGIAALPFVRIQPLRLTISLRLPIRTRPLALAPT